MTTYRSGDLVLVAFPFASGTQTKQRPAMVIFDAGDADIVVARVTTQFYESPYDVVILGWQGAGLLAPSVIRLHKLATIEKALVRRALGRLQQGDRQRPVAVLQHMFGG